MCGGLSTDINVRQQSSFLKKPIHYLRQTHASEYDTLHTVFQTHNREPNECVRHMINKLDIMAHKWEIMALSVVTAKLEGRVEFVMSRNEEKAGWENDEVKKRACAGGGADRCE